MTARAWFRIGGADLVEELREEMARHRLELCAHSLYAVQHWAFALDVYLWDHCYRARAASSRLARYHALAEHPGPWPSPENLRAFEEDLRKVREQLRRLQDEAHRFELSF